MLLSKYISGTIFIDDKKDDVEKLIQYFELYNIWSKFIDPNEFDEKLNHNYVGARLVFLDLQYNLSGSAEIIRAVNILRQLSDSGIKNFILVVWSMHSSEMDDLSKTIDEKMGINKPLVILDADKEKCLNISFEEFSEKMDKIFEDSIKINPLVYCMLEWEKNILFASRDTFNDIVSLSYNGSNNSFDLNKVLLEMSKASANDIQVKSSFAYMHDLLSDNIIKYSESIEEKTLNDSLENDEMLKLKLNALQMIKKDNLQKNSPGDVYITKLTDAAKKAFLKDVIPGLDIDILNEKIISIELDITPPCTFLKSDKSIMIAGLIINDYNDIMKKKLNNVKQNFLVNFYYDDGNKKIIILDFIRINYIDKTNNDLEKIFSLKSEFRSSVQQQFGSFLTRIGDNIIHLK